MSRKTDLQFMVGKSEKILWQGKPSFLCFMMECIFKKIITYILAYGVFTVAFLYFFVSSGTIKFSITPGWSANNIILMAVGLFFLIPLVITLIDILLSILMYRNMEYIITDRGVYISGGTFSYSYEMKSFMEMSHVDIRRGIFDQIFGVGDVIMTCDHETMNASGTYGAGSLLVQRKGVNPMKFRFAICDVKDFRDVFYLVKSLQTNIYSDVMYPNDLRPEENHGYRSQYVKKDAVEEEK